MAFVFAATPKEEQMSPSPLHTHSHRHRSDFIIKLKSACTHICVQFAQAYEETGEQQVYRYSL